MTAAQRRVLTRQLRAIDRHLLALRARRATIFARLDILGRPFGLNRVLRDVGLRPVATPTVRVARGRRR